MKVFDIIHRYKTRNFSNYDSLCRVRYFLNNNSEKIIIITDLGEYNPSASVTNSIELIHESLIEEGLIPFDSTVIEQYEGSIDEFSIVTFDSDNNPTWRGLSHNKIVEMVNCDEVEFSKKTCSNERLLGMIERKRYEINPEVDFGFPDSPEVKQRRSELYLRSISKKDISNLIMNGAKEQELSRLLKKDLSIFGEVYSFPEEEYICFSEFPLDDGFVDYVIFTGRSRMNVYIIEVKGADFNLVNRTGYQKFSSKIDTAATQIRNRQRVIYSNYEKYRKYFHKIRETVEKGDKLYNSTIGPRGKLLVDPNKDINIFPVLIGGRTNDDLSESKLRQDFEYSTKPTIKLESWDTFLRKLRRR